MSKKTIEQICRKFKKDMQKIVDKDNGVTGISIVVGREKFIIAEKKQKGYTK